MSKILDDAVTQDESDGSWGFTCPGIIGQTCGVPGDDSRNFTSTLWPTKKVATARGAQHFEDHKLGAHFIAARDAAQAEDPEAELDQAALLAQVMADTGLRPTPSLEDFRAEHNLTQHSNGTHAVRIEDLP